MVQPIQLVRELPPPPVVVVNAPPPPPIITYTTQRPLFGGLVIEDFRRHRRPVVEVVFTREDPRRQRLFQLSVELGDNLFRRGRYQEANRHFELALTVADDAATSKCVSAAASRSAAAARLRDRSWLLRRRWSGPARA